MNSTTLRQRKSRLLKAGFDRPEDDDADIVRRIGNPHRWPLAMLPEVIAQSAVWEVSAFLDMHIPRRYERWLALKADVCFQKNDRFRRSMRGRGNAPRDTLRMFMRHWLAALLGTERPDLLSYLPEPFDLGHPLPAGPHERVRRRRGSLFRFRPWNSERVLSHPRWHFLREYGQGETNGGKA